MKKDKKRDDPSTRKPTTVNLGVDARARLYAIAANRQAKTLKRVSIQSLLEEAVNDFIERNI